MFLLIDTADCREVERALETFPLAGVTTCPTIIVRAGKPFYQALRDIRSLIGEEKLLHAQVMGSTCEEIYRDAMTMRERVFGTFFVKVPVTTAGFQAMTRLHREKVSFTATTIHTAAQGFLAADHGASFLAPYVNRIDDLGGSGEEVIRQMAEFLRMQGLSAKILAASFRNSRQITNAILAGAHTVTLAPDLLWKLAAHPGTDAAVAKFRADWDGAYGPGHNVADL